jgi:hypothetical protein
MGFPLGKLPPDFSRPRLLLGPHLKSIAFDYPPADDNITQVPSYPMYANDRYGDCVWAMTGHAIQAWTLLGQRSEVTLSEDDIIAAYSAVTGFDPATGANDNGTVMQDAMEYWVKTGVGGRKILAFAQVDHTDLEEVKAAIHVFGSVLVGFNFPKVAWSQFDQGRPWDVTSNDGAIQGGHAIHVGGYEDGATKLTTWGKVTGMTWAFWNKYVDECWVAITQDWLDAQGHNPEGVDLHGLGEDFSQLTGKPNPFPVQPPEPPQPPPPGPDPNPVVVADAADVDLAAAVRKWWGRPHWSLRNLFLKRALLQWATRKGLKL